MLTAREASKEASVALTEAEKHRLRLALGRVAEQTGAAPETERMRLLADALADAG